MKRKTKLFEKHFFDIYHFLHFFYLWRMSTRLPSSGIIELSTIPVFLKRVKTVLMLRNVWYNNLWPPIAKPRPAIGITSWWGFVAQGICGKVLWALECVVGRRVLRSSIKVRLRLPAPFTHSRRLWGWYTSQPSWVSKWDQNSLLPVPGEVDSGYQSLWWMGGG